MFLLVSLVTEADAVKTLTMGASGMKLEADRKLEGKPHRCLFVDWPRHGISAPGRAESKLVAQNRAGPRGGRSQRGGPPGKQLSRLDISWTSKSIKAGVPARNAFAFQPPKGFTEVAQGAVLERP